MLNKTIFALATSALLFLTVFSSPISAQTSPITVNYAVEVWEDFNPSFPGTTITFYGRLNDSDSWHSISTTNMSGPDAYGVWQAQFGISNTLYDDFAIAIANPPGWTAIGAYMRGTPPHQNCNKVNANRQECIGIRSTPEVYGETFNWNFNPPSTPTPTPRYSYCQSGACLIRNTEPPGMTSCEGVVNGCFCLNVKCLTSMDCILQTGANSCNVCNTATHKCGFATATAIPTSKPTLTPRPTSTPTPTPQQNKYSYCKSGACKIGTSLGMTSCEGVRNGCYCLNVKCLTSMDCILQTGANSCNVCNPTTRKCSFTK